MPRTTHTVSTPSFIADPASVTRSTGRQVDFDDVASSFADDAGNKVIPAGHRVYLTEDGLITTTAGSGEDTNELFGLIETNAVENDRSAALTGYGVVRGGIVYLELLPETLDGAAQTALAAVGTGFAFEPYNDSRAS